MKKEIILFLDSLIYFNFDWLGARYSRYVEILLVSQHSSIEPQVLPFKSLKAQVKTPSDFICPFNPFHRIWLSCIVFRNSFEFYFLSPVEISNAYSLMKNSVIPSFLMGRDPAKTHWGYESPMVTHWAGWQEWESVQIPAS